MSLPFPSQLLSGITVHGRGRVTVRPDEAALSLGIETQDREATRAHEEAGRRMAGVLAALEAIGIAADDVTTTTLSLSPTYDYSGSRPRLTGYQATQGVTVKVRDLGTVAAIIDGCVAAGATQVGAVSFTVADPSAAGDAARRLAVEDALRHARTLAAAAGVGVGAVVRITEMGGPPPQPVMLERAAFAAADMGGTPVSPGTTEIVVEVEATFALA
jgi:uncharacterized protein